MNTQWRKICENLQNRLNPGSYKVWIEPLRGRIITDRTLPEQPVTSRIEVFAPSAFVANWVRERLLPQILEAAAEVCGRAVDVSIGFDAFSLPVAGAPEAASPRAVKPVQQGLSQAVPAPAFALCPEAHAPNMVPGPVPNPASNLAPNLASNLVPGLVKNAADDEIGSPVAFVSLMEGGTDMTSMANLANPDLNSQDRSVPDLTGPAMRQPFPSPVFSSSQEQLSLPYTLPFRQQTAPRAWRYAFDSFVVGPTNDMAYAAARNMSRASASVDMLFLSSGPGLGKTHLTQAVGHALCGASNRANPKVEYLTAEEFSSCFVQALRMRDMDRFKGRFRDIDLLLLEDIHFLQGKEKMQDEVLSTIKTLQGRGSRVVLTSSFAPCDLKNVDNQLVSRFCSGFLAGIEKPDADTRRRILVEKAREHGTTLPDPIVEMLAERLSGDIRQLESCVHTLILKGRLQGHDISIDMALEILAQYAQENPLLSVDAIIRKVCEGFSLSLDQLSSRSRKQDHVVARNTIFYLARRHTSLSLQDIGDRFNRRHSTVLKGIAAVERELRRESSLGRQIASTLALVERA